MMLMLCCRGANVSVLQARSTSESWERSPPTAGGRYPGAGLVKHQSLGGPPQPPQRELSVSGMCSRELSPVRWCDQEVDGVYLGRSGWVQVHQRSLDDPRRAVLPATSLPQYRRPNIRLADYHCNSEPGKQVELLQRPAYLPLKTRDIEGVEYAGGPSSPLHLNLPEPFSPPPPVTPIISPPPAFQDRVRSRPRYAYGKPPFLPRSDAIVDSDVISPPRSPAQPLPPVNWGTLPTASLTRKTRLTPSPVSGHSYRQQHTRIPQAKSLEEATNRRTQFMQRYKDSSSSSSSSLGFRSLDSVVSRPAMPRLLEHGSIDMYEDADEEDNNSSSLNLSNVSSIILNSSPDSVVERALREKSSPSSRPTRLLHYRSQSHRSPSSSDVNKQVTCSSPSSSSSSSSGFPIRSPSNSGNAFRRSAPSRQHTTSRATQDDLQRVRRSRSLQLPEKRSPGSAVTVTVNREQIRASPQPATERPKRIVQNYSNEQLDEEMLREAEVVSEFLYGTRSRAAAKALLFHRYNDRRDEGNLPLEVPKPPNNGYNFYIVGNNKLQRQKAMLVRGATVAPSPSPTGGVGSDKRPCSSSTCDFWPHCAQRESLNSQAQSVYAGARVSPSYPRSPQTGVGGRRAITPVDRDRDDSEVSVQQHVRELTVGRRIPGTGPVMGPGTVASGGRSPPALAPVPCPVPHISSCSSSSSDIWITSSDRTVARTSPRTPLEEPPPPREMILTRPGSAPVNVEEERSREASESQKRSMSLPKSFLSGRNKLRSVTFSIIINFVTLDISSFYNLV